MMRSIGYKKKKRKKKEEGKRNELFDHLLKQSFPEKPRGTQDAHRLCIGHDWNNGIFETSQTIFA